MAWLLHRPGVTAPIVGSTKVTHMQDALVAEQLTLDSDEMKRLEEPYVPHRFPRPRLIVRRPIPLTRTSSHSQVLE